MKKFLLTSVLICSLFALKAQNVYLNEVYPNKGNNFNEYFELFNAGIDISGENLSSYSLVTYFSGSNGEKGFYVLNLPNQILTSQRYFTGSSQNFFSYPAGSATASYNWNDAAYLSSHGGSTLKYTLNSAGTGYTVTSGSFDDIFIQSNGQANNNNNGSYTVLLFRNGMLQDAVLGSSTSNTLPAYVASMPSLPATAVNGATMDISFSAIASSSFVFNNVPAAIGNNGGYYLQGEGHNCGKWAKATAATEFSPNMSNGSGSNSLNVQVNFTCGGTTLTYNILSGPNPSFPVVVSLYYDVNDNQLFDPADVLVGSHTDLSASDPAYTFTVVPDVSLILVFDASTGNDCSDQIMTFDCAAGGPLPVSLLNFNVVKRLPFIALTWETSMESNNRGFEIQRRVNGNFEAIGFVDTKGLKGYSNDLLSYNFEDNASLPNGTVYYRLRQLDYDGHAAYSDIKAVRNNSKEISVTVYPNPSNGNAKLIIPSDAGKMDISLVDLTGRVLSRFADFNGTKLDINNMRPGVYMIRVLFKETGEQVIQKLIVQ
ncbi:MAG: T9SS type A sorting domain-containing protein [Ferruginibacter sp.]